MYGQSDVISIACKRACEKLGLGKEDVRKIFCDNAVKLFGIND